MTVRVRRFDTGSLAPAEKTREGYLRCEGRIARAGNVQVYVNEDGTERREYRPPEEVFAPASLASLDGVPFTLEHPPQLLDANTAKVYAVGAVSQPRRDGDYVAARILVYDAKAIEAIERGDAQELSVGYDCSLDETPGTSPTGEAYHCIQRGIVGNHTAATRKARAGDGARMRLDSAGNAVLAPADGPAYVAVQQTEPRTETAPMKIRIGKHHLDASDANATIVQEAIDRELADLTARCDTATADKAKIAGERDAAVKRADSTLTRWRKAWACIKARLDGMKARHIACDECGGSGMVPKMDRRGGSKAGGAEGQQKAMFAAMEESGTRTSEKADEDMESCGYCDGSGKVRLHDAIKAMAPAPDAPEESPDEDIEDMASELAEEPVAEKADFSQSGNAAEQAAMFAKMEEEGTRVTKKADKGKRADSRKVARQKRADSLARMADRRARSRAALLATAGKHLDSGEFDKVKGAPDLDVARAVVAKLAPHLDSVEKMPAAQVATLYTSEVARAEKGGGQVSPSAALTQGMFPSVGGQRQDSARKAHDLAVARANHAMYPHAYPNPDATAK